MDQALPRRTFIGATGIAGLVGLAGCTSLGGEGAGGPDDERSADGTAGTAETTEAGSDESGDGSVPREDVLYAFAPESIAVVDPDAAEVVAEVADAPADMEPKDAVASADGRRLFVNDEARSQVVVIDTERGAVEAEVDVGSGITHAFRPRPGEIWTHADDEGTFYVVDAASLSVTDRVVSGDDETGHGKLVSHEDLGAKAYATNTDDAAVHAIDLDAKEKTGSVSLPEGSGTHYAAYSPRSGHLYVEYTDAEVTAVVDAEAEELIGHLDVSGGLYASPGGEVLAVVDGHGGEVHVVDAAADDEVVASIPVEGGPDKVYFHEGDDGLWGFTTNTADSNSAVVDFEAFEVATRIDVGEIERPEGAEHLHRSGTTGGGYFFTPASADGTVAIVDADARELHGTVPVEGSVTQVAYVGSSS
ncbi:YncE family protein [Halegenticoccus tardaugens]|uniref:YncE family protein n=1 Tax=Halegenticoccus tardaugens TaxID=2071624 RepID=UPI00100A729D|nr:hypothetical protein [Halegenticoccus tardaugens]